MNEPKTFASLGPTLLARKGGARPAMRPQVAPMTAMDSAPLANPIAHDLEDLGWNDMGAEDGHASPPRVLALTPAAAPAPTQLESQRADAAARAPQAQPETPVRAKPEVHRQQHAIAAAVGASAAETSREPQPERIRHRALESGRRAAFTLRLDAQRHLKLRLASTIKNRSAQQLVTAALDRFLADIPEIDALAAQVKRD